MLTQNKTQLDRKNIENNIVDIDMKTLKSDKS